MTILTLIQDLLNERQLDLDISEVPEEQHLLYRALVNTRPPLPLSNELISLEINYLKEYRKATTITTLSDLEASQVSNNLYLWQGDITTLAVDAIVNAANNQMLGCFVPNHNCIDNAIHTYAGMPLRQYCQDMMFKQGHLEKTGLAKLTPAFNLPSKAILHTVGPIIQDEVKAYQIKQLASCYQSCLQLTVDNDLTSIAFCCISTGEFRFPKKLAAQTAIKTVRLFQMKHPKIKVLFNVFSDQDLVIYQELLGLT